MTRMAGTLRHHNVGLDGIIASLKKANEEQCEPPLPDSEVETIARSVSRYDSEAEYEPPVHVSHDLLTVSLSQVKREKVSWLWYQRIPLGLITLVEGDGGVCKSWFTMVIAAHVSTGRPLPGHEDNPIMGPVIIMSAEDSLGGVIKGRLEDAGADNSKITAVTGLRDEHGEKQVSLRDLPRIDQMCEEVHPKLLIVDPIVAYLGGNDMNHAGSVRGLLAPLHAMAERHQLSVILVRHLNKATDQAAKYRGQGSIDFYSACRSAFQVIPDSVNRNRRHVVHVKSNYGPLVPTQEFEIHNSVLQFGDTNFCSAEELYARLANAHKSNGSNSGGGTNSSYQGVL